MSISSGRCENEGTRGACCRFLLVAASSDAPLEVVDFLTAVWPLAVGEERHSIGTAARPPAKEVAHAAVNLHLGVLFSRRSPRGGGDTRHTRTSYGTKQLVIIGFAPYCSNNTLTSHAAPKHCALIGRILDITPSYVDSIQSSERA